MEKIIQKLIEQNHLTGITIPKIRKALWQNNVKYVDILLDSYTFIVMKTIKQEAPELCKWSEEEQTEVYLDSLCKY